MKKVTFGLDAVPREVRDDLARPLALAVDTYFRRPGVEEKFQAWLVEYNERKSACEKAEQDRE